METRTETTGIVNPETGEYIVWEMKCSRCGLVEDWYGSEVAADNAGHTHRC